MKTIALLVFILLHVKSYSQLFNTELYGGLGISGINQIITNSVEFDETIKFNKKVNILNNRVNNVPLYSGLLAISLSSKTGILSQFSANFILGIYNFRGVYYKEDEFVFGARGDTINSPNWLIPANSLPFIGLGVSKNIKILKNVNLEFGVFFSYIIDVTYTSNVTLWDSVYAGGEKTSYIFDQEMKNDQFDQYNYGITSAISFFPSKPIFPKLIYTQGLNDISKRGFKLNQHANIWSICLTLVHKFSHQSKKQKPKHDIE